MKPLCFSLILLVMLLGCGGAGNSEPVGLYEGRWRGNWESGTQSGIIELRFSRTGIVSGTFERDAISFGADISGSLTKNGDLEATYDATGGPEGTLAGRLRFDGGINRITGTLSRTEGEDTSDIDASLTRR